MMPWKSLRRSEPEQRGLDVRRIRLEAEGRIEQLHVAVRNLLSLFRQKRPRLGAKTRPAGRRGGDFDTVIRTGDVDGRGCRPSNGRRRRAGRDRPPAAAPGKSAPVWLPASADTSCCCEATRTGSRILLAGLQVEIAGHVLLSRIDGSPIGVGIAVSGVFHLPAAPVDRQAGVAPFSVELDFVQKRPLPAAMQVQQARQLVVRLWESRRMPPCEPVAP